MDRSTEVRKAGVGQCLHPKELLERYQNSTGEEEATAYLEDLIHLYAKPIIARTQTQWRRRSPDTQAEGRHLLNDPDPEELFNDTVLKILERVDRLKCNSSLDCLRCFCGYVVRVTERVCAQQLRLKTPAYSSLSNQVRYRLINHEEFSLWRGDGGRLLCGFGQWEGSESYLDWSRIETLLVQGKFEVKDGETPGEKCLHAILLRIFTVTNGPLQFGDLARLMTRLLGVEELVISLGWDSNLDAQGMPGGQGEATPGVDIEYRGRIANLWSEIKALPPPQATSLLLNLRDGNGRGVIDLFLLLDLAEVEEIASTLCMTPGELEQLWNALPLSDNQIAQRLGVTRQQVINLRKTARARLQRRIKDST